MSCRLLLAVGERVNVVIVGAGSAGLAVSHELTAAGVEHVVLERGQVGQTWRDRWESFCLVTPNWTVRLPGGEYDGPEPEGFMPRDEIVAHMRRYAASFSAPVRETIEVTALELAPQGGLLLRSSEGEIRAASVVLATGAYQKPHRPTGADTLPPWLLQLDAEGYTNPDQLPPGKVLVVGERPDWLPAGGGAPGSRPRRVPRLWSSALEPTPAGGPRHRLVDGRDTLL